MATKPAAQPAPRPIIIRRVRKVVGGGHHGGAWKVAYADFVTAMMAFFMLLWLIANPDQERLKGLAEYFSPSSASSKPGETVEGAPGSQPALGGERKQAPSAQAADDRKDARSQYANTIAAGGGTAGVPDASLRVIAEELRLLLQPSSTPNSAQQRIMMERAREGLRVSLMDDGNRSMFRGGTAVLNPHARLVLQQIARRLAPSRLQIAIEGHTDGSGGQSQARTMPSSAAPSRCTGQSKAMIRPRPSSPPL